MDFGFSEDEHTTAAARGINSNKLPFSYSSSPSSSSSSPHHHHQYKAAAATTCGGGAALMDNPRSNNGGGPNPVWGEASIYDGGHHHSQRGYAEDEEGGCGGGGGPDTKLELMNSSPRNDDVRRGADSDGGGRRSIEREHMFDKVVTPSDVGKLNRLVIPKQHAEKYFPLDSAANEKGLLLNFEDRNGKPWRFRYSYWNSSQSYVMTKGWSRFVKEKKLDAGDIVSFQRGVGELGKDRLYIDWRRRPDAAPDAAAAAAGIPFSFHHYNHHLHHHHSFHGRSIPWSPSLMRPPQPTAAASSMSMQQQRDQYLHYSQMNNNYGATTINLHPYRTSYGSGGGGVGESGATAGGGGGSYGFGNVVNSMCSGPVFYLRSTAAVAPQEEQSSGMVHHHNQLQLAQTVAGGVVEPMVFDSVPVVHGKAAAAAKRLRLFGVNMECSPTSESEECELLTSAAGDQPPLSSSPTSLQAGPLQLRLYNGTPIPGISTVDFLNKGKASNMPSSFNFDNI